MATTNTQTRNYNCSACGNSGHNRNNRNCPLFVNETAPNDMRRRNYYIYQNQHRNELRNNQIEEENMNLQMRDRLNQILYDPIEEYDIPFLTTQEIRYILMNVRFQEIIQTTTCHFKQMQLTVKNSLENSTNIECGICYETQNSTNIIKTNCDHQICTTCIIDYANNNNKTKQMPNCPFCRTELNNLTVETEDKKQELITAFNKL